MAKKNGVYEHSGDLIPVEITSAVGNSFGISSKSEICPASLTTSIAPSSPTQYSEVDDYSTASNNLAPYLLTLKGLRNISKNIELVNDFKMEASLRNVSEKGESRENPSYIVNNVAFYSNLHKIYIAGAEDLSVGEDGYRKVYTGIIDFPTRTVGDTTYKYFRSGYKPVITLSAKWGTTGVPPNNFTVILDSRPPTETDLFDYTDSNRFRFKLINLQPKNMTGGITIYLNVFAVGLKGKYFPEVEYEE